MIKLLHIPTGNFVVFIHSEKDGTLNYEDSFSYNYMKRPIKQFISVVCNSPRVVLQPNSFLYLHTPLQKDEFEIIYD